MLKESDNQKILKKLLHEAFFKKCVEIFDSKDSRTVKVDRVQLEIEVTKRLFNYTLY